ncbi:MAG: cupin domain-containing protein [Candidatus Thorarchaeota archaeon]|jgi:D-beta-D-heptose 7-phosphate kinase/D-beta-D-heptose 1-phosphate adenosyltransferase
MPGKIFPSIESFMKEFGDAYHESNVPIVATSGGFDPVHIGHLRCIQGTNEIAMEMNGVSVIIVNGDGFLVRKKGKPFMRHQERMEIIAGLEGVDFVVGWDDGTQTVTGAIELLKPAVFAKGGDRSDADKVPEFILCEEIGCDVRFGVGGREKVQSSSVLIASSESPEERMKRSHPDSFDMLYRDKEWEIAKEARIVDKPWGMEEILVECERYAAKILTILPHQRLSLQYHEKKDETIYVMDGTLKLEIGDGDDLETRFLLKGDYFRITPGTIHRFTSWFGIVKLFEVSTPELDDVIRLADDYNRHV